MGAPNIADCLKGNSNTRPPLFMAQIIVIGSSNMIFPWPVDYNLWDIVVKILRVPKSW